MKSSAVTITSFGRARVQVALGAVLSKKADRVRCSLLGEKADEQAHYIEVAIGGILFCYKSFIVNFAGFCCRIERVGSILDSGDCRRQRGGVQIDHWLLRDRETYRL
jgi:hypothetical protein